MMIRNKTLTGILLTTLVAFVSIVAAVSILKTVHAQQQHKSTTLTVGVGEQVFFVEQGSNVILKIRLPHGVTARLWADNSCDSPKNNAMTISVSGTYTIAEQSIKGHGEKYVCLLSSDGNINTSISLRSQQLSSGTSLVSSRNPAPVGQSLTFTATVVATNGATGTPTGNVTFNDGATALATVALNNSGAAAFTTSSLAAGAHPVTAIYGGDSNFAGSTSAVLTEYVTKPSTTIVTSSVNPSVYGQAVKFTATISGSGGTPTGTVTFQDGASTLGTGTLNSSGVATFTTTAPLSVGGHSITAVYAGDNSFTGSTSGALTQTVNKSASNAVVTSPNNPSVSGQSVTFTATVTAASPGTGTPTGIVSFKDGAATAGTGPLNASGVATFTTSSLSASAHSITAVYAGDNSFTGSTSGALTQTVNKSASNAVVTSSNNPSVSGQSVTFTATVTAASPGTGTPAGTVTFKDGATTLGTGTLNASGVATLTTSALSVATHSITAAYGGNGNFNAATSAALTQTVKAH